MTAAAGTHVPYSSARSVSTVLLEQSANARALEGLSSRPLIAATAGAEVLLTHCAFYVFI